MGNVHGHGGVDGQPGDDILHRVISDYGHTVTGTHATFN